jgi:16S rRNA (cytidine1402-2'-O)-methyltransferase
MKLYVLATPIGNLGDISNRALEILRSADLIVCEDTRVSKHLLDHYKISKPLYSYHQHSNSLVINKIIQKVSTGENIVYITDAGTPGISDPGGKLVAYLQYILKDKLQVIPIPGPSAMLAALSVSGFPTDSFLFVGFIPHKKGRQTILKKIQLSDITVVCYESVHRIEKLLAEIQVLMPERLIVVARELTKKFEKIYRGRPVEVAQNLKNDMVKGEFVVVFSPANFIEKYD